ncbi:MAG: hypothetical protein ACTFAL_08455 [Candidatus Electronema sp. V4]|uniref:hypothetical protein n=1 Tax=Candidatus Electronema sp. V4 TaxID=3454756 RepID=UPI0040553987
MKKNIEKKCLFSITDAVVYVILIFISICFFCYVNSAVKPINEWETLKYATPDSKTYLDVGKWLFDAADFNDVKSSVAIRPFFYPLIVASLELIHPWAIWIFQFILWQSQVFMVYVSCVKISNSKSLAFIIALASISIISPIGMTLHALTETLASFFITFSVFVLTLNLYIKSYFYLYIYLLLLSLCSVVKPSMLYIYLFSIIAIASNLKNQRLFHMLILAITVIPILVQVHIMKKYFYTYKVSFIDTSTVNDYFLSGVELYKRNLENDMNKYQYIHIIRDARRGYIAKMIAKDGYKKTSKNIKNEFFDNLTNYPIENFRQFKDLIIENSIQPSLYFLLKNKYKNKLFFNITLSQSKLLLVINIISILEFITIFYLAIILKKISIPDGYIIYSLLVFFCIYFIYMSTGITFWQGDRFLVPIYYASIILFVYQTECLFSVIRKVRATRQRPPDDFIQPAGA